MAPSLLKEFTLALSANSFLEGFWLNAQWYERFLVDKLHDIDITVDDWTPDASNPKLQHRKSIKSQSAELILHGENKTKVVVKESNSFNGIPYADYFTVHTEWTAVSETGKHECAVTVLLEVRFVKSTWLQGTIESNTKAELLQVVETWLEFATHHIRQQSWANVQHQHHHQQQQQQNQQMPMQEQSQAFPSLPISERADADGLDELDLDELEDRSSHSHRSSDAPSTYFSDEEEALFYDCEEGERASLMKPTRRSSSTANLSRSRTSSVIFSGDSSGRYARSPKSRGSGGSGDSTRDMAVNIVETGFVLAQFSFWQVYQFYAYDLKDLFNVEPDKVVTRILNSFLPGYHSPLLVHPDLYGPLLAVFLLPQTLLLSMETSKHGCNPTSQLGNAVLVCVLIWLGLAAVYRLLALVIAPSIGIKQCLSILGYSFFSWNLALLCTMPLERHFASSYDSLQVDHFSTVNATQTHGIHSDPFLQGGGGHHVQTDRAHGGGLLPMAMYIPLVVLGLPCSMAQGYIFWEHTPASSLTLQPSALPHSMQHFATQHSRCLQRLLWAFPKILAFVLVAGTHYQLLWYIARIFLPGRRQLCRLTALMQPGQYADILTQKELRLFALKLLSGRVED